MKFENIDRKALVKALAENTEAKATYKGAPTFAYEISYFTVSRDVSLSCNDMADNEEIDKVLAALAQRGFCCAGTEYDQPQPEIEDEEPQEDCPSAYAQADAIGLTVSIPLDMVAAGNLTNLLEAKGSLIKKALGVDNLPIEITEDTIAFPWFSTMPELDEVNAYTQLIAALCKMSKAQKRISAKATDPENEKYAFRCFLLRLGFIGDEYKTSRKILLRRLSGNSAWKGGTGHAITE
ncbi:MAG: virulence protein [Christensenella sp.]|nr:virulence protein [Christensenella sp.]